MTVRATKDTSMYPYVDNYPPLRDWLRKHNARCMWQTPRSGNGAGVEIETYGYPNSYVEGWLVGRRICVIVVHANTLGWEIYTAADTNAIDASLADAEERLGVQE